METDWTHTVAARAMQVLSVPHLAGPVDGTFPTSSIMKRVAQWSVNRRSSEKLHHNNKFSGSTAAQLVRIVGSWFATWFLAKGFLELLSCKTADAQMLAAVAFGKLKLTFQTHSSKLREIKMRQRDHKATIAPASTCVYCGSSHN
jgi:hypothetical protein